MIIWSPSKDSVENAHVTSLIKKIEKENNISFLDYHAFQRWTAENPEKFWKEVAEFCGIKFHQKAEKIIGDPHSMPGARWFKGATLNYAENLLRFNDEKKALVFWNENGFRSSYSYQELHERVSIMQSFFKEQGVQQGDVVAAYMPNIPETIIAFLAAASIGAVWSSSSPDFSVNAVYDRFSQIKPKILISADAYLYKGKKISILENVKDLSKRLESVKKVLICPYIDQNPDISGIPNSVSLSKINPKVGSLEIKDFPAEHPLFILYSSGTTGKPKCIVHSAIGILIEHAKEHALEVNINREDIIFYNTTCGWMMWNWLVGVLFQGATVVLYDGFAMHEDKEHENQGKQTLLKMLEDEKVTVFGTSASYLQKIEELGIIPKQQANLSALKRVLSTGSRLKPESFDYVYKAIGDVHLSPIWGGTDLCGCLGIASAVLPVRRGEIQTRGLGFDLAIMDETGKSIRNEAGEVVVRKPFPSMPLGFVNDADGSKYKAAYFEHFPGTWRHGDLAIITENEGILVLGRSDDTLNPGGVRIGAAEITQAAEKIKGVSEAMAIGQVWSNDERIILFVIMKEGATLTQDVKDEISNAMPSPRHKPKIIIEAPDFPTTLSGKRSAKTIRDIINGREAGNKDALANPQVLDYYKNLKELK